MSPKQIVLQWIEAFNTADVPALGSLYAPDAVNHQMPNECIEGREAIMTMFRQEFAQANMVCIPIQLIAENDWVVLEWRDPNGLQGCGFFHIQNGFIQTQRGYWDKLSFLRLNHLA
jgi:limonene-1,2-epoxide hydrolase